MAGQEKQHVNIWAIAWPMMLSGMSVPLLGLVDTALLGHLDSERFLGAIAIGANFVGLMYWSFGFLRMSTTGLSAVARGQGSRAGGDVAYGAADAIVFRSLVLGLALGSAVMLAIPLLADTIVGWMQASEAVAPLAREYIEIRKYSAPAVFMTFAISGWLIGLQQARRALALVLATNLANIALDIWFIVYLGWESAGAARATLIAEWLGLGLGLYFLLRGSGIFVSTNLQQMLHKWRMWLKPGELKAVLGINYHLLVRTVLLLFVFNFFTAQGAGFGDTLLAANAILLQLVLFSAYVIDGFSFAAEALCGEAWGARNWFRLKRLVRDCLYWAATASALFMLVYWLIPGQIIGLLTDMPDVSATALAYRQWVIAIVAAGFAAYIMDGLFIGIGKTRAMNYSMCLSVIGMFLPCWWLTQGWGNNGLWLAYLLFTLMRGVSLGGYWVYLQRRLPFSESKLT